MCDKIKVLWVTNALGCGGAERQMLYMYDIIKEYCNIDVTILYYAKVGNALDIGGYNTVFIDKSKLGPAKTIQSISKYIRENNIQIMHAFGGSSANIYGRFGAVGTKAVPVGAMLGKKHFAKTTFKIINSFLNLFGNWWTVNNLDLIPILKNDLKFVSSNKIRMLHNGFVPAEKVDYKTGIETEYDLDKGDNFVFMVAGRLQPVKNYGLYLRAAKEVLKTHGKLRFWVVGDGDEYDKLQQTAKELGIEDNVKFWGYSTDVDAIMARSDVFVQTSFTEGSPNTIAEAMRAKKPIISTKSTDLSEMIEDDENGYVTENDNCKVLVEAMNMILGKTHEELEAMGRKSYELFENNFLDVNVAADFQSFYEEILKKSPAVKCQEKNK